jgi:signal transduction histidine kinase
MKERFSFEIVNKKLLFLVALALFVFSCNKEGVPDFDEQTDQELSWFEDYENYTDIVAYHQKLLTTYNAFIDAKEYEKAQGLLNSNQSMLYNNYLFDSLSISLTISFLENHNQIETNKLSVKLPYFLGNQYLDAGNGQKTIYWAKKALEFNQEFGSGQMDVDIYNLLGAGHVLINEYKQAVKYFMKALTIAESENDVVGMALIHSNMFKHYNILHAFNEAEKSYLKSLELFQKAGSKNEFEYEYFFTKHLYVSQLYEFKRDSSKILKVLDTLIFEIEQATELPELILNFYDHAKSMKFALLHEYDSAYHYIEKTISFYNLSSEYEERNYLASYEMEEIELQFQRMGSIEDEQKLLKLVDAESENKDFNFISGVYNLLYRNALQEKDYAEALNFRNKEIEARDSVLARNMDGQLFELEIKYETEKKEAELVKQRQVIVQNNLIITILVLSLAFIITVFFIVSQIKKRRRVQADMQRQQDFTSQLFLNTEEERSRIANELHDGVNHQLLTIKNNIATDKKIQAEDIGEVIEEVRNISRNLHPSILQTAGFEVAINNLCDRVTEAGLFATCEIDYLHKLSKNKELQLYRIIQEALNNTLKHGKANAAKVILTSQDNFLHLEIKDNGSGFDVDEQINNSKSFGLQSILQRAKAIMAKVNIQSSTKGTVILIKIPVQ